MLLSTVLWTVGAGAQNPGIKPDKEIVQPAAANQALEARVQSLTEQNARLGETIDKLQSQLNAAKGATGDKQSPALATALVALAAVQQELAAANNEIKTLQRENGDLNNTVANLQHDVDGGQATQQIQTLRQELSNADAQIAQLKDQASAPIDGGQATQQVQTLRQELANANAQISQLKNEARTPTGTGKTIDDTQAQQQEQQAQIDALTRSNEAASRTRWIWAASAAMLAAGLSAAGVRHWWPRSTQVTRPVSVSARLGDWSLSAPPGPASPAFAVTARWLPGASQVSAAGPLVAHPRVAVVQGEAA